MIAEVICVGTELLMGQVVNTNGAFLSRRLNALGITQQHQTVVGDNPQRLEECYIQALSRADVVITSGGLGPTVDDITKKVAAKAIGKELVLFPDAEKMVRERFAEYHREMTPNNISQAMFVPGTKILINNRGTAPGAIVPAGDGKVIIHLPGPPSELEPMFSEEVEPYLAEKADCKLLSKYIRIFGEGESKTDQILHDLEMNAEPTLSPYCSTGEVVYRATTRCRNEAEGQAKLEKLIDKVAERLGKSIYAVEDDEKGSLAKTCVEKLTAKELTVATAESLTGGMIASELVNIPGASNVLRGGMITYQTDTKTILAGVTENTIKQFGVVSSQTACEMAKGAMEKLGASIGVSATGVAGPGGGTEETPVGTVFVGIATEKNVRSVKLELTGTRERIRTLTMKNALFEVIRETETAE